MHLTHETIIVLTIYFAACAVFGAYGLYRLCVLEKREKKWRSLVGHIEYAHNTFFDISFKRGAGRQLLEHEAAGHSSNIRNLKKELGYE